jgi:hypothetical protein
MDMAKRVWEERTSVFFWGLRERINITKANLLGLEERASVAAMVIYLGKLPCQLLGPLFNPGAPSSWLF